MAKSSVAKKSKAADLIATLRAQSRATLTTLTPWKFKYGQNIKLPPELAWEQVPIGQAQIQLQNASQVGLHSGVIDLRQEFPECMVLPPAIAETLAGIETKWQEHNPHFLDLLSRFTHLVWIEVEKDTVIDEPVLVGVSPQTDWSGVLIVGYMASHSRVSLQVRLQGVADSSAQVMSEAIHLHLETSAYVEATIVQDLLPTTDHLAWHSGVIGKQAHLGWRQVVLGSRYHLSSSVGVLRGDGGSTFNGLYYLGLDKSRHNCYTASLHEAPQTVSNIFTKGVVTGSAQALSRSLVRIEDTADGANGYEKQEALLLRPDAEVDAIPNLEINHHNVKCSHGSTIGQVDKEALFYLMARGLDRRDATAALIGGYFSEVIAQFGSEDLAWSIAQKIAEMVQDE